MKVTPSAAARPARRPIWRTHPVTAFAVFVSVNLSIAYPAYLGLSVLAVLFTAVFEKLYRISRQIEELYRTFALLEESGRELLTVARAASVDMQIIAALTWGQEETEDDEQGDCQVH